MLFKAEMQPLRVANAKAVFVAASPNRIEVARGVPLAGEGRRLFRKSILEPAGLQEEETGFLYLVPRCLNREPRAEEIDAWRPWVLQQLQTMNPRVVVSLGKAAAEEGLAAIPCLIPMPSFAVVTPGSWSARPSVSRSLWRRPRTSILI